MILLIFGNYIDLTPKTNALVQWRKPCYNEQSGWYQNSNPITVTIFQIKIHLWYILLIGSIPKREILLLKSANLSTLLQKDFRSQYHI